MTILLRRGNLILCVFARYVLVENIAALVWIEELIYLFEERPHITVITSLAKGQLMKFRNPVLIITTKDTMILLYQKQLMILNTCHIKQKTQLMIPLLNMNIGLEQENLMVKLNIIIILSLSKFLIKGHKTFVFNHISQERQDLKEVQHIMHNSALRRRKMYLSLPIINTSRKGHLLKAKLPIILSLSPINYSQHGKEDAVINAQMVANVLTFLQEQVDFKERAITKPIISHIKSIRATVQYQIYPHTQDNAPHKIPMSITVHKNINGIDNSDKNYSLIFLHLNYPCFLYFILQFQIFLRLKIMKHHNTETITIDNVINSYQLLESPDPQQRYQANRFLCGISLREEAWEIAQNMLTNLPDPKFQLLGTQILYQKVSNQIHSLSPSAKNQLRQFVFTKLSDSNISFGPTIDKLASIGALIGCTSCMAGEGWETLIMDLIGFMGKSPHQLKTGLYVIERIPEELRATNRLNLSKKNAIIERLLENQKELAHVFLTVLEMNDDIMIKKCMQAMQSWAKSRFNFLMYTEVIKKVLVQSLISFTKFQSGIVMILQTIKGAQINKSGSSSISQWQPDKQIIKYQASQIQSIKLLIQFITENQQNFLTQSVQSQYLDMFTDIIKQSLLSFGFLIKEDIGFKLLDIIVYFTKSSDLRTSHGTFQFWMDFSQKMLKCKIDQQIKNYFGTYMDQLFQIVSKKIIVQSETLLDDPDLKEDVTIDDDINCMSFAEYRKQSSTLYQCIYNFFASFTGSPQFYFDKCFEFVGSEANGQLGKGTQLALFCIKSVSQSIIYEQGAEYICKFLSFVIDKGTSVYSRIVVQALLLIRDCTRQIKRDNNLCLKALNYSLYYLKDQGICYYAADAFKTLMETLTTVSQPLIIQNMLNFYRTEKFPNQQIIDKIIEGIFSTIAKMNNNQAIKHYLKQFVQIVLKRFQQVHTNIKETDDRPYFLPILQIKTILDNFDGQQVNFKNNHQDLHRQILSIGLKMIEIVIPYSIKQKQKYVKFNQLGISCSIYKLALKLCHQDISQQFLSILDLIFVRLNKETIVEMYPVLELLSSTMTYFVPKNCPNLNAWLMERIIFIDKFFLDYMKDIHSADVDVIRCFYQIQQSLVLYNSQIFITLGNYNTIFQLGLWILRHLNEAKMQRKVVNFLFICSQMTQVFISNFPKVVEVVLGCIPITNSITHCNLGKMFIIVCQQIPNIQQTLLKCLKSNPYEGLSQTMIKMLIKLMMMVIRPNYQISQKKRQRRMIMIIKDLYQLAKSGQMPNQVIQMEFRCVNWAKNKGEDD